MSEARDRLAHGEPVPMLMHLPVMGPLPDLPVWTKVPTPKGSDRFGGAITCSRCLETWQVLPIPETAVVEIIMANVRAAELHGWSVPGLLPVGRGLCPRCRS